MNLSEIRTDVRMFLRESTAGFWTNAHVNRCINRAIQEINRRWNWHYVERTGTFSTVDGTAEYALPWYVRNVFSMRDTTTDTFLKVISASEYDEKIIDAPTTEGYPARVYLWKFDTTREPTTGTNTADATTSTTAIVDAGITSDTDDYYNNWLLINSTRSGWARVSDYDGSTNTLSLDRAIASQASGDSYFLQKNLQMLTIDPTPDAAYTITYRYRIRQADLSNDYEVPEMPENWHDLIVDYAAAEAFRIRGLFQQMNIAMQRFGQGMINLLREQERIIDGKLYTIEDGTRSSAGVNDY